MTHILGRIHILDRRILDRLNSALMIGLFGGGLLGCAMGAIVYDFGRLFSAW